MKIIEGVCSDLDFSDSFFDSFRLLYSDFDVWTIKIINEHRTVFYTLDDFNKISSVCILQPKDNFSSVKICSFKIGDNSHINGDFLLKHVFCRINCLYPKNSIIYLTVPSFDCPIYYFFLKYNFKISENKQFLFLKAQ